ncbi:hypothetical protein DXG03_006844 [Asterophora parasitica]|uniref:Defective in cullin neddylation protein n=1 Tax=Asterophora parasitica TaxID=117018 RepID=A0A9P7GDC2_9AGAR|nr:hypothetical protein DXG03_006844 [Asterophora parasitica]
MVDFDRTRDARKFLEKYKRVDIAVDAYYNNPSEFASSTRQQPTAAPSTSKLTTLFNKYKDPDEEEITVDGTIKLCEDLDVDPEDVVLLAAFWSLLLPHGLQGGALSHTKDVSEDGDVSMEYEEGWKAEYVQWWFDFLNEKGGKGVSKDTWAMVRARRLSILAIEPNFQPPVL